MTTKAQQITSKHMRTLALVAVLWISSGTHALCLNADGSLDDSSMNTASIDRGLLPACKVQLTAPAQVVEPQEPTAKPAAEPAQPVKKSKRADQNPCA